MSKFPNIAFLNHPYVVMKFLLLSVLISFPGLIMAQWTYVQPPAAILGIYLKVVNEDTVFFSSEDYGRIYRTFDGAETWEEFQTTVSNAEIHDFDFPTPEIGFAIGQIPFTPDNAFVFKTEDGGLTWNTIELENTDFHATGHIAFLNPDTGFVASGYTFLRTEDGGANFSTFEVPFPANALIWKLISTSDGVVYVSTNYAEWTPQQSNRFSIYRSADFGETWDEVYSNTQLNVPNTNIYIIRDIDFPTPEVGYAVGGNGRFLKSTDAGLTWTESFISPVYNLRAVSFTSADTGYINNEGGVYKTTDGGNTWIDQNVAFTDVMGIQFASANAGYAFTITGIYKTVNAGGNVGVEEPEIADGVKVFPNPTRDFVTVLCDDDRIENVEIIDLTGKKVVGKNRNFESINLSKVAPGTYFLRIKTGKSIVVRKLVVE